MRSWKYFNKEEATKFAKGNLALQNIPLTEENVKNELDNVYTEWLWLKIIDTMSEKNETIVESESNAIYYQLKEIPTKYYSIILQWLYNEPIHYEGKYFNFEKIYNNAKKRTDELGKIYAFHKLVESIACFDNYEESMKEDNLCKKKIEMYEKFLKGDMGRVFFLEE
jgi:hypothetical protein